MAGRPIPGQAFFTGSSQLLWKPEQTPCLVIHYFQLGHGGGDILVRVPIPAGKEQEAKEAVRELENAFA